MQSPGSSNLVIRPTTIGEGGVPTSISLTHQQLQQLKVIPSTQSSNIGKNIVVGGQQIATTQFQGQAPFTLAIRTNPASQTMPGQQPQVTQSLEPAPPQQQPPPPTQEHDLPE